MKELLKRLTPKFLTQWREKAPVEDPYAHFASMSPVEVFTKVYEDGIWAVPPGPDGTPVPFDSGRGSSDPVIVDPYVDAVGTFLRTLDKKPDVVDLGCGDFQVGARLRPLCGGYIACDIVEGLMAHNRVTYAELDVEFRTVDSTRDPLPAGDVLFIRQVLQHLSNADIATTLDKIKGSYDYLILTEHLPLKTKFPPNRDKPSGPRIRKSWRPPSGVVITELPFAFEVTEARVLCEISDPNGRIVTTLYRLPRDPTVQG